MVWFGFIKRHLVMIKFYKAEDKIILLHRADDYRNPKWVSQELDEDGEVSIKKTFRFR